MSVEKINPFYGQDILSANQFDRESLALVTSVAHTMKDVVLREGGTDLLKFNLMTALFYEPSSRTYASFLSAMQRLGGGIIPIQGVAFSSVAKGETLADTVATFEGYSDLVVLRHPEVGSARIAANVMEKPLINAGDGVGEHPTQAALDLFTIMDRFGEQSMSNLTVTMVGDLLNGRTVHSLTKLLSNYPGIQLNFVSPQLLQMPHFIIEELESKGVRIQIMETLDDILNATDVLYVTRIQRERFREMGMDDEIYNQLKHHYVITPQTMLTLPDSAILMHPLPRVGEIHENVDSDDRAVYLREQVPNGMFVRMALLALVLKEQVNL